MATKKMAVKKPAKKLLAVPAKKKPAPPAKKKPASPAKKKPAPPAKKKPAPPAKKKPASPAKKKPAPPAKKKPAPPAKKKLASPAKKRPAPKSARARGVTVDAYAAKQGGWQRSVIADLREIVREGAPGATEEIKWGQPVYNWNGPFAHIKAFPSSVQLGFWRGATLRDPKGLLAGSGERMKHVKITSPAQVNHAAFVALVREAVRLNDELGDPTRR